LANKQGNHLSFNQLLIASLGETVISILNKGMRAEVGHFTHVKPGNGS
jgi:hypothetical protein